MILLMLFLKPSSQHGVNSPVADWKHIVQMFNKQQGWAGHHSDTLAQLLLNSFCGFSVPVETFCWTTSMPPVFPIIM